MPKPNCDIIKNNIVQWKTVHRLFSCLLIYKFYKFCDGFINKDLSLKTLDELKNMNKVKLLIKKLNNNNIYINGLNIIFHKNFNLKYKKLFLVEKINGKMNMYLWHFDKTIHGIISLLMYVNKNNKVLNFPLVAINIKFKPMFYNIVHPINGSIINNLKILGTCKSDNNVAFLSYYVWKPNLCLRGCGELLNILKSTESTILYLNNMSDNESIVDKLVFRGRELNEYRRKLYNLYSDNNDLFDIKDCTKKQNDYFIPFLEQRRYKYILDMHGLSGHSGRRFWMFHFNRVLFLPIDDPLKLFWEVSDNPPEPWVHFVPYSLKKLEELESLVIKLESEPELYNKIKRNGYEYCKKYLSFNSIIKFIINSLN